MFGKSSEKYLLIVGVFAIIFIDACHSATFITPPLKHPGKLTIRSPNDFLPIYFQSM